ncbi:MAG: hypothetical protein NC548_28620 [Lachnospiraceae bacterium]|nr:hypothetical protein [Lachnospiraceae bacterium]
MYYYMPIKRKSLFNRYYAYIDTVNYVADKLLFEAGVKPKYLQEYAKPNTNLVVILCRVPKELAGKFEVALQQLGDKFLLIGLNVAEQSSELYATFERYWEEQGELRAS